MSERLRLTPLPIDPVTGATLRPRDVFAPLQVRDDALRAAGIDSVFERLQHYELTADTDPTGNARGCLMVLLPTVQRLSYECPFPDIRGACAGYLERLRRERSILLPLPAPSSVFIAPEQLRPRDGGEGGDPQTRAACEVSFFTYGRVSNMSHALLAHPSYLSCMLTTFNVVLHDEGPLPQPWRAFIAIMASARHRCTYLMQRQFDAFLECGGDAEWLSRGLACPTLPPKLAALAEVNALLAHRPWRLTAAHIKDLAQGLAGTGGGPCGGSAGPAPGPGSASGSSGSSSWSLNELVHALVIMATFHSLASLALALGVAREADNGALAGLHASKPVDARAQVIPPHLRAAFGLPPEGEGDSDGAAALSVKIGGGSAAGEDGDGASSGSGAPPTPVAAAHGGAGVASGAAAAALYSHRSVKAGERELRARLLAATRDVGALDELDQLEAASKLHHHHKHGGGGAGDAGGDAAPSGSGSRSSDSEGDSDGDGASGSGSAARAAGSSGADSSQAQIAGTNAKRQDGPAAVSAAAVPAPAVAACPTEDDEEAGGWSLNKAAAPAAAAAAPAATAAAADQDDGSSESGSEDDDDDDDDSESGDRSSYDDSDDDDDDEEDVETFEDAGRGAAIDAAAAAAAAAASAYTADVDAEGGVLASAVLQAAGGDVGVGVTPLARSQASPFLGSGCVTHAPPKRAPRPGASAAPAAAAVPVAAGLVRKERRKARRAARAAAAAGGAAPPVPAAGESDSDGQDSDGAAPAAGKKVAADGTKADGAPAAPAAALAPAPEAAASSAAPASEAAPAAEAAPDATAATAAAESAAAETEGEGIAGLMYRDFDTSEGMFVTHDFGWEDHAYALLQRFFPTAAPVLDRQFHLTFNLTYRTFGGHDRDVNTEPFRSAIWYYTQRLYGVRNDHYDYSLVNKLLPIPTKTFLKKVACFPEIITAADFHGFTTTFTADERVHIVMLVCEARRQAGLLYALRAVMRHMTG